MEKINKNTKDESPVFILLGLATTKLLFRGVVIVSQTPALSPQLAVLLLKTPSLQFSESPESS